MNSTGKPLPSKSILIQPPRLLKRLKLCQVEPEFPLIADSELESPIFEFDVLPPTPIINFLPRPTESTLNVDEFFDLPITPRLVPTVRPLTPIPTLASEYSSPFMGSRDAPSNARCFKNSDALDTLMEVACFDSFVNRTYDLRCRSGLLKCRE